MAAKLTALFDEDPPKMTYEDMLTSNEAQNFTGLRRPQRLHGMPSGRADRGDLARGRIGKQV